MDWGQIRTTPQQNKWANLTTYPQVNGWNTIKKFVSGVSSTLAPPIMKSLANIGAVGANDLGNVQMLLNKPEQAQKSFDKAIAARQYAGTMGNFDEGFKSGATTLIKGGLSAGQTALTAGGLPLVNASRLVTAGLLGGAMSKIGGSDFITGAGQAVGSFPQILGFVGATNPILAKYLPKNSQISDKVLGAGGNAIQGIGMDLARGTPTTPLGVGIDLATGALGGTTQFDIPNVKSLNPDVFVSDKNILNEAKQQLKTGIELDPFSKLGKDLDNMYKNYGLASYPDWNKLSIEERVNVLDDRVSEMAKQWGNNVKMGITDDKPIKTGTIKSPSITSNRPDLTNETLNKGFGEIDDLHTIDPKTGKLISKSQPIKIGGDEFIRYANDVNANTDDYRGGTWFTNKDGAGTILDAMDPRYVSEVGIGGDKQFKLTNKPKNPLIVKDAELNEGSFNVINAGYENFIPAPYREIANDLYEKVIKGSPSKDKADIIIMDSLYEAGVPEEKALNVMNLLGKNKFDAAMDLIIGMGLKEEGYDSLVLESGEGKHVMMFESKLEPIQTGQLKVKTNKQPIKAGGERPETQLLKKITNLYNEVKDDDVAFGPEHLAYVQKDIDFLKNFNSNNPKDVTRLKNLTESWNEFDIPIEQKAESWLTDWVGGDDFGSQYNPTKKIIEYFDKPEFKPNKPIKIYKAIDATWNNKKDFLNEMNDKVSSWTTSKDVAKSFGDYYEGGSKIIERIVSPDEIMIDVEKLPTKLKKRIYENMGGNPGEQEIILKPLKILKGIFKK